jgi:FAD/FMN-containing dehydrogenase/Fe-S oxidoreductase
MPFHLNDLEQALGANKVLSDPPAITAYSIDASIYKVPPKAVALIESPDDLEKALRYARVAKVPVTARSGGTNVTGNAVGAGIILEFSRMNKIIEVNQREQWARVEPGIVYAQLNRALAKKGLMFAPDPSSGDMCKLGGMLGNNAAGPHTLKYGATKDNVIEMTVLLHNGNWITAREYDLTDTTFKVMVKQNPFIGEWINLIQQNREMILSKKRSVSKNAAGYNLFAIAEGLAQNKIPLHQLFIGSEGTLGLTTEARIKLHRRPTDIATGLVYFDRLADIGDAVNDLLTLSPSALEMMDKNSLDLVARQGFDFPKGANALLLVEFDQDAATRMAAAEQKMRCYDLSAPMTVGFGEANQAKLWQVRKAMYPTLYQYDLKKKPINFADDVVVAAHRIPQLIAYLDRLFLDQKVPVAIYGHIGNGNAHINPLLCLSDENDFNKMVFLYHKIHETVIEHFGGSICGEHGDGRVRAEMLPQLYGPELYGLFKKTKALFDPDSILNPGVKISETPFTIGIDIERLSKQCATCGKCNSVCPVYDVVGEESNAARGWFHVVTDADYTYEKSSRVVEACINCKSCRVVCPAGIDVSEEVMKRREEHPNPVAGAIFDLQHNHPALFAGMLRLAAYTQFLWDNKLVRVVIERVTRPFLKRLASTARIPADMVLPKFARTHLRDRYSRLTKTKGEVAYFHGCAANYFDDGVGDAIIRLLEDKLRMKVALPPQRCSGTPIQTYGYMNRVRENARFNIDALDAYDKIVTGCASCTLMLKDYPKILTEGDYHEKAKSVARKVAHITEMLPLTGDNKGTGSTVGVTPVGGGKAGAVRRNKTKKIRVTYHSSCHLRAAGVHHTPRELLRRHPGFEYVEMPDADRCAGGAGTFCIKNPELSEKIFERKRRGIEESGAEIVATSCPACMIQLQNGLKGKVVVKHIAELL